MELPPFSTSPPRLPAKAETSQTCTSLRPVALLSLSDGFGPSAQALKSLQVKSVLYFSFEMTQRVSAAAPLNIVTLSTVTMPLQSTRAV